MLNAVEIVFEVPAERVDFMLDMLRNLAFVKNPRPKKSPKTAPADTTDYLLASPANAERLRQAYQQFDNRERVDFILPAE